MRPVIPKVRVGDILVGTKNLRNWLQTGSLLNYVSQLASGHPQNSKRDSLYIPTKKDRFVVAVNAWETFAVWGLDREAVILFCNPSDAPRVPLSRRKPRRRDTDQAMSPALFAQWFIRTPGKKPDLINTWPDHAYHLWAALQMNAISHPEHLLGYSVPPGREASFTIPHLGYDVDRANMREIVRQTIQAGLILRKQRRRSPAGGRTYGPHLEDISRWQEQIRRVTSDPRIRKRFKEKVTLEVPQAVFDMLVNQ